DVSAGSGLDIAGYNMGVAIGDVNNDGWPDVLVTQYRGVRLFLNNGNGTFTDVTEEAGLRDPLWATSASFVDYDRDGWPDLFVAHDAAANHLWINQRDGTFHEEAVQRGLAFNARGQAEGNMGIALGDVDGDGLPDLFVTHLTSETHTLWKQGPRGLFRDRTTRAGLASTRWRGTGFGTALADFDHDGAPDLVVVNGRVARGS